MARTAVLGLPRIGPDRELKFALERYWAGDAGAPELLETARDLRAAGWERARAAGIDVIPSGDSSLYDHVLDTAWALGAIPARFGELDRDDLGAYFALARGTAEPAPARDDEVVRHQLPLPRARAGAAGSASSCAPDHWTEPLREAAALGIVTRPVVLGPLSFLLLVEGPRAPARRARRSWSRCTPSCSRELPRAGATRGADRRAVPGARPDGRRARRLRRGVDALERGTELELCLATYFAPARRDARARARAPRRRAAPRPGARAGQLDAGARGAARRRGCRSASSTAATCGPPTSTRAGADRRRDGGARQPTA